MMDLFKKNKNFDSLTHDKKKFEIFDFKTLLKMFFTLFLF